MKEKIRRITMDTTTTETKIEKTVTISFDGKQFLVRIPNEISDFLKLKKGNKLKFILDIPYIEKTEEKAMVVEVVGT
jgi:hypothetical protein